MYTGGYNAGLGFAASTDTGGGVNIFDPASYSSLLDTSQWDWHEYLLAGLAGYFAISWLAGGFKSRVVRPIQQGRRKSAQRSKKKERLQKQLAEL